MMMSPYDVVRQSVIILAPEVLLLLTATAMMTAGAFVRLSARAWFAVALTAVAVATLLLVVIANQTTDVYASIALNDAFSYFGRMVLLLMGLVVTALAYDQVDNARAAEYFGSLLMIQAGSMLVAASNELVFLFVGLELVSIPTYLLLYLPRRTVTTQEAATKYFFLSIFSSALLLFGLAYLYGLTGISNLKAMAYLVGHVATAPEPHFALIALVFVMAGLGFRVAAVPFHFYAPDVYEGSPTIIAGLLSWVPKAIGFLAMLRTITAVFSAADPAGELAHKGVLLAWLLAVPTMTLGNTLALSQNNLRRLLAYSSIAHAGYLLIGIAVAFQDDPAALGMISGAESVLYYLVTYPLMTLGVFGVIILLSSPERRVETVDDLSGLARTHPMVAFAMAICLFSLAGIPPLAGFWGKLFVFASALSATGGKSSGLFWSLAVIGAINAAIGAYYYLRIVVGMYFRNPPEEPLLPRANRPATIALAFCTLGTLFFYAVQGPITRASHAAAVAAVSLPDPRSPEALKTAEIDRR
jgi:NADH-quinone oxidoreductase subunit N